MKVNHKKRDMTFKKENFTTTLNKAKMLVPGFREAFSRFEERLVLDQLSEAISRIYFKTDTYE
jgi:hypothetical protein